MSDEKKKKKVHISFTGSKPHVELEDADEEGSKNKKEVTGRKIGKLQELFGVEDEEELVNRYTCSLEFTVPHAGTMYITTHYVLFYSKFPAKETKRIKLLEISSVEKKKKSAIVIPNAMEIKTKGDKTYFFAGFLKRDDAFETIERQRVAVEELRKKEEKEGHRVMREKTANEVTEVVKTYNILNKMKPVTLDDDEPPKSKCARCTII